MKDLDYILPPVDKALLKRELTKDRLLRTTNKLNNEIYYLDYHVAPNVVTEIGRLRELTFASAGGGTGKAVDLDIHDTGEHCYSQLIVWNPEKEEIVGGYRYMDCGSKDSILEYLSTSQYFTISPLFLEKYLPFTLELGRSWIQPEYQSTKNPKEGLFALDNLWDGLGALIVHHPHIKYLFGKVTVYSSFPEECKKALAFFLEHYFPDKQNLITPLSPVSYNANIEDLSASLKKEKEIKKALRILSLFMKERGVNIPPLISSYIQLSSTMRTFGAIKNREFGHVDETAILLTVEDVYVEKRKRYIDSFREYLRSLKKT